MFPHFFLFFFVKLNITIFLAYGAASTITTTEKIKRKQ